jgi:hypothetical protein
MKDVIWVWAFVLLAWATLPFVSRTSFVRGRDDGIIYCVENPEECKVYYSYFKLKRGENPK